MKKKTKDYFKNNSLKDIKSIKIPKAIFHIALILIGVILIIIGGSDESVSINIPIVKSVLLSMGQGVFVGSFISIVLELPHMKDYFRSRIIDVLISRDYLKTVGEDQVRNIRQACTETIYIKDTEHFDNSLLDLDEDITGLLSKPYVDTYRGDITCEINENHIVKKTKIRYKVVNPNYGKTLEKFGGQIFLYKIDGFENSNLFKVKRFSVKIDDHANKNITDKIELNINQDLDSNTGYDLKTTIENTDKEVLNWEYENHIEIEIEDERVIPIFDNIYIKRINDKPVKSIQISYTIDSKGYSLDGSGFGTMSKYEKGQISVVKNHNNIRIESFNWLLPGNGILIALLDNKT